MSQVTVPVNVRPNLWTFNGYIPFNTGFVGNLDVYIEQFGYDLTNFDGINKSQRIKIEVPSNNYMFDSTIPFTSNFTGTVNNWFSSIGIDLSNYDGVSKTQRINVNIPQVVPKVYQIRLEFVGENINQYCYITDMTPLPANQTVTFKNDDLNDYPDYFGKFYLCVQFYTENNFFKCRYYYFYLHNSTDLLNVSSKFYLFQITKTPGQDSFTDFNLYFNDNNGNNIFQYYIHIYNSFKFTCLNIKNNVLDY